MQTKTDRTQALALVRLLLGCYRAGSVADPEIFAEALVANLERHDFDVCKAVLSPVSGLPSKLKFVPTIAEVRAALDEEAAYRARIAKARAPLPAIEHDRSEPDHKRGAVLGKLKEQFPGLFVGNRRARKARADRSRLAEMAAAAGVDINSIPDAPMSWRKVGADT